MFIKAIKLNNFRNYNQATADFDEQFNLISGVNGEGKTNLVESILFASLAGSPRTHHDEELIKDGEECANVQLQVERSFGTVDIEYSIADNKKFYINGNLVSKIADVFGNLVTIFFSPKDINIVSGSPQDRRDFMDTDISQLSGKYYSLVQRYNKILNQRNKLLKQTSDHKLILDQIDIWDEQLASIAAPIIRTRKSYINKLKTPCQDAMNHISKGKEVINIDYIGIDGNSAEEIKANIIKLLRENLNKDMVLGYTSIGPHRDDIKIEINGKDSKIYASQGQQRSLVLAIKIGELNLFNKELGEKPILVLDDVFSELDSVRQKKLYDSICGYQVFLTGTTFKFKPKDFSFKQFRIKNHCIKTVK